LIQASANKIRDYYCVSLSLEVVMAWLRQVELRNQYSYNISNNSVFRSF